MSELGPWLPAESDAEGFTQPDGKRQAGHDGSNGILLFYLKIYSNGDLSWSWRSRGLGRGGERERERGRSGRQRRGGIKETTRHEVVAYCTCQLVFIL